MGSEMCIRDSGKKAGDKIMVYVNDNYSYEAVIKSITKAEDDGSAPILQY